MESSHDRWACLSLTSLFGLFFLLLFVFIELKFNQFSHSCAIIISAFIVPTGTIFLGISGFGKKIWEAWKSLPKIMHQLVSIMCMFWIGFFIIKSLPIALKKEYEKK